MDVKIVLEIAPEDVTELARGHTLITHVAGVTLHIMGSEELRREYERCVSGGLREGSLAERLESEVRTQEETLKTIINGDGELGISALSCKNRRKKALDPKVFKESLKRLYEEGLPDSQAKIIKALGLHPTGETYRLLRDSAKELGIPLPAKKIRKKRATPRADAGEQESNDPSTQSPMEIFERVAREALINTLSEEELRELQRLYTHHTYGERVWDDKLTPPERRVLRQLEEKGLARSSTEEHDKMKPRYFWEIKRRGIELIEEAMK